MIDKQQKCIARKEKMKKLLAASFAAIMLVGCTVESDNDNDSSYTPPKQSYTPTPTPTPEEPSSSASSVDDAFLSALYSSYPELRSQGGSFLIDLGKNLCTAIDGGLTLVGLAQLAIEYGVDAEMLGFITGAAIVAYCPRNSWFVPGGGY